MKKRRGSPCKHRYSGTCKNLRQGTNKYYLIMIIIYLLSISYFKIFKKGLCYKL